MRGGHQEWRAEFKLVELYHRWSPEPEGSLEIPFRRGSRVLDALPQDVVAQGNSAATGIRPAGLRPAVPPGLGLPKSPAGAGAFFGLAPASSPASRHLLRQQGYRRMRAAQPKYLTSGAFPAVAPRAPLATAIPDSDTRCVPPKRRFATSTQGATVARRAAGGPACGIRESALAPRRHGWPSSCAKASSSSSAIEGYQRPGGDWKGSELRQAFARRSR